ncbi:Holliday junction branch migration complex subunit RuvA [Trichinella pseudospiralis]
MRFADLLKLICIWTGKKRLHARKPAAMLNFVVVRCAYIFTSTDEKRRITFNLLTTGISPLFHIFYSTTVDHHTPHNNIIADNHPFLYYNT